ncbi:cupin domain-containing protein [Pseudomonas sp. S9]|uniref:cupin domain-containing protein n=1 Tax=Pseudomonas sp. S9 TaxID=686578 RepID=UPI00025573EB|nr:cupin domain-containing protein [Pseudomonas sp. S9]
MANLGNEIKFGDVTIKILSNSDDLTVSEIEIPAGAIATPHQHPHEEVNYVVSGSLDFMSEGETVTLHAGQSITIDPNQLHNITNSSNTTGVVLSVWTPSRKDLIAKLA